MRSVQYCSSYKKKKTLQDKEDLWSDETPPQFANNYPRGWSARVTASIKYKNDDFRCKSRASYHV